MSRPRRLDRLLVPPLLALVAAIVAVRGVRLWQDPHRLDAHEERTWLAWSYRDPETAALFARIERALDPGEPVALVVPRGRSGLDADWYRGMALYYLPGREVAAVVERGSGETLPAGVTVVALRWNGGLAVRRPGSRPTVDGAEPEEPAGPAALAGGTLAALAVGLALLRPVPLRRALAPGVLGLALVAGLTLLVAAGFALARLGAPAGPAAVAALALALSGLLFAARRRGPPIPPSEVPSEVPADSSEVDPLAWLAGALLALALGLFLAKLALAPLWTWDHFFVWGLKARRMIAAGRLDLAFLDLPLYWPAQPHYPLAVPAIWRLLALGGLPGALAFKAAHALFGLALVGVARHGFLLLSRSRPAANGLASVLAVSPVLWDTVALGHADVVLGLWALAALVLVLAAMAAPGGAARGTLALAGLLAGFLPWIKQEGALVAPAVLAAAVLFLLLRAPAVGRRALLAALALPAAATLAGSRLVAHVSRVQGIAFFADDWWARAAERLKAPGMILSPAAEALLAPDWLGFWLVLPAILAAAALLRRREALVLCGLAAGLAAAYVAVYFATSLPPVDHLRGSLYRILCPLEPLGLLGVAALLAPRAPRVA